MADKANHRLALLGAVLATVGTAVTLRKRAQKLSLNARLVREDGGRQSPGKVYMSVNGAGNAIGAEFLAARSSDHWCPITDATILSPRAYHGGMLGTPHPDGPTVHLYRTRYQANRPGYLNRSANMLGTLARLSNTVPDVESALQRGADKALSRGDKAEALAALIAAQAESAAIDAESAPDAIAGCDAKPKGDNMVPRPAMPFDGWAFIGEHATR